MSVYVLDASAFINADLFSFGRDLFFSTRLVFDEIKDSKSKQMAESAYIGKSLVLKEPSDRGWDEARKLASESTDDSELSGPDLSILALCLDLKREAREFTLVTDDYALQNVAKRFGIPFETILAKPIANVIEWFYLCPKCRNEYDKKPHFGLCKKCGNPVVKKKKKLFDE